MPKVNVRALERRDHTAVARVWHEAWHDAHDPILPPQITQEGRGLDAFGKAVPRWTGNVRVGTFDGEVMGFVKWRDDAYIDYLFVAGAARGTGLASRLIQAAEAEIAASGRARVGLDYVQGNKRAARFYAREGYRIVGQQTDRRDGTDLSWISIICEKDLMVKRKD